MDSISAGGNGLEAATQAATVHLEQAFDAGTPPETEPQAPEPQAPPDGNPVDEPAPQPASESYDFDYNGQRTKLTKAELEYLVRFGLDAYSRAQQQPQGQQAPRPQAQAQAQPQSAEAKYLERLERLEKQLEEANTQRERDRIQGNIDAALGKLDMFTKASDDDDRAILKELTSMALYGNPHLSADSAAKKAAERLEAWSRRNHQAYVAAKIAAAANKPTKGGASPSGGGKPFSGKDMLRKDGTSIVDAVTARLKQFAGRS